MHHSSDSPGHMLQSGDHRSRALCWLLRHGAVTQRLPVIDAGFVPIDAVLSHPTCRAIRLRPAELQQIVATSMSARDCATPRFEMRLIDGVAHVRATYGRTFCVQRTPGSVAGPKSLSELCVCLIAAQLKHYPAWAVQALDGHSRHLLLRRLAETNRLSNGKLRMLLGPELRSLDLCSVPVTAPTVRALRVCSGLYSLSLANASVLNDSLAAQLFAPQCARSRARARAQPAPTAQDKAQAKQQGEAMRGVAPLPALRELNLHACRGIGGRALRAITTGCPQLTYLNVSNCAQLRDRDIVQLAPLKALAQLRVHGCTSLTRAGLQSLRIHDEHWARDARASAWLERLPPSYK